MENIDFSNENKLNGGITLPGTGFTMGGIVAQTAGVPINETLVSNATLNAEWESENNYLPGAWTIGDILEEAGYHQEFLIGSNGRFAGRSSFFKGHGNYEVVDYYKILEQGRIPEGYYVFWGYEDKKLFSFAKEDLLKLSSSGKPFNLTMLTVDTHFTDGYVCELCRNDFDGQYNNVLSCSSRQVNEFVQWVQKQDFYANTTIVIAGDHCTMDSAYIEREGVTDYERKAYFTIINPAPGLSERNTTREISTLDFYPTTLAALGVKIEGERLGLGVNLFSDTITLVEEYGKDYVWEELLKNSDFYTKRLLYGKEYVIPENPEISVSERGERTMESLFILITICPALYMVFIEKKERASFSIEEGILQFIVWFYGITFLNLVLLYLRGWREYSFERFSVQFLIKYMISSVVLTAFLASVNLLIKKYREKNREEGQETDRKQDGSKIG